MLSVILSNEKILKFSKVCMELLKVSTESPQASSKLILAKLYVQRHFHVVKHTRKFHKEVRKVRIINKYKKRQFVCLLSRTSILGNYSAYFELWEGKWWWVCTNFSYHDKYATSYTMERRRNACWGLRFTRAELTYLTFWRTPQVKWQMSQGKVSQPKPKEKRQLELWTVMFHVSHITSHMLVRQYYQPFVQKLAD